MRTSFRAFPKHGDVPAYHGLQFSQPWKCPSAVGSTVHCALHDGALRIHGYATGTAYNVSSSAREHLLPRRQREETY